ncbi:NAD(P)-dependent alcohol dehydrogenase [Streptomyces sp. NA02950]|uniref:NAD(P)-dependent alcohol dehydrogenase n=1 Tax=Streptomyces sp. NA02950 TaxID=2742137 RepID=UPI001591B053|nr:NAD(P)-dependent alcohol dehydrogenase [Streptomyces sp. NA02950]QKV96221.1 NAD(P)-dependent alcohol dehydrogenase [Streptomyces sp. NA02950]
MKAVRLSHYHENPVVEDVPEPRISSPQDVIVQIGGAGLCRTDLHVVEGQWQEKSGVELPYTLGHENAGWVKEIGPGVSHLAIGDPVIVHPLMACGLCRPCRSGDDVHCTASAFPGIDCDGGMAELMLTSARSCVKLDPGLEPADVAALADAGLTAYHAVRKAVPLLYPGTSVVVIGAGGLGHIGVQCLVALTAAEIVVVDTSEAALELAKSLGAHHGVLATGDPVAAVQELTAGQGAHVVIDFVGERGTESQGIAMLRRAGSYFAVGYGGHVNIPTIDVISAEINVVGNLVGSYNDLDELMALAARGEVRLHTATYPLDAVRDAMDDLANGRLQGRGILVPGA